LDLFDNGLGSEGGIAVAEALKTNTSLRSLDLESNGLGSEGGIAVAAALKTNTSLSSLNLWDNDLGSEGGIAFAEALKTNTSLSSLNLAGNDLRSDGGIAVAKALKTNTSLSSLDLGRNGIPEDVCSDIEQLLTRNAELREKRQEEADTDTDAETETETETETDAETETETETETDTDTKWEAAEKEEAESEAAEKAAEGEKTVAQKDSVQEPPVEKAAVDKAAAERGALNVQAGPSRPTSASSKTSKRPLLPDTLAMLQEATQKQDSVEASQGSSVQPEACSLASRLGDVALEDSGVRTPLQGLFDHCDVVKPLEDALLPVRHMLPPLKTYLRTTLRKAQEVIDDIHPGFPENEARYIVLYTMDFQPREKSVYFVMNASLRDYDREAVKPWVDYIWGLLKSLKMLPKRPETVLFRGCKGDISRFPRYKKNRETVWYGFSSTSPDLEVQQQFTGKEGNRVLFQLQMRTACGRDIRDFSMYPGETEILLPPNVQFVVKGLNDFGHGLHMIHLEEVEEPDEVILSMD
jgi:hypothetical protein